jgi:hypothetical protein
MEFLVAASRRDGTPKGVIVDSLQAAFSQVLQFRQSGFREISVRESNYELVSIDQLR